LTDILTSVLLAFAATFTPLLIGSFIGIILPERIPKAAMAAAGVGILVWLFIDLMLDADVLDVDKGFVGGLTQVALVLAFLVALGLLIFADKGFLSPGPLPFSVALLAAVALGLHSAGEAMDLGSGFASIGLNEMLGSAAVAFLLHKALEGFMLSSFLIAGVSQPRLRNAGLLSLIVGLMAAVATPLGFYSVLSSTYVLAAGSGGNIYLLLRLTPQALKLDGRGKFVLAFFLGFLLIYLAALLHS
jgi:hypothetical protein